MRTECVKHAIKLAKTVKKPFCELAKSAVEVGVIVPSILKANLEKAGYVVTYHVGPGEIAEQGNAKHGAWVQVRKDNVLVARAYSHDEGDALLQSVYAEMKVEAK